ncbi:head to tail connecting protein [Caudoviricetes sp.]|nr:head to tail connecting protein [Caudoviricetes sp.]
MITDTVTHILKRYEDAQAKRQPFDADWTSIRDFVRPVTVSFNKTTGQFTSVRPETMYDGTASDALEELAAALHSYMTSSAERWFELQIHGTPKNKLSYDELAWLEECTNIIYSYYQRDDCNLYASLHEVYLDLGSYGTACLNQEWDSDTGGFVFTAHPLAHSYFLENSKGRVDTMFNCRTWTLRQLKQEFGKLTPELMKINNDEKAVEVIHYVGPRTDRPIGASPTRKAFASIWIVVSTKEIIHESGYDTFPYHCPRWTKLSGEFYGRGPARRCLPDIKMLNAMEKTTLKAGQKQVDPPLVLANEGFLLPIRTSPGSLIFKEDEERQITPLEMKGNLPWAEDKMEQKRDFIRRCFFNDWIRREKKKREQSATEIMDDRDEMLRLFSPILGRITNELHGPMVARSYYLLDERRKLPMAPQSLENRRLSVGYTSAAARAQIGSIANQISQFLQDLIPMAQVDPSIMDAVDMDIVAQELAIARGTPRTILRSPEALKALRQQKQAMQSAQQLSEIAEPASKAVKNIADAQQAGGLEGML